MKKVNRKQFCEECSNVEGVPLSMNTLNPDISRKKVIVDEKGLIDLDNEINKAYMEKKKASSSKQLATKITEFDAEKKRIEAERAKEELLTARIKRQKMEGEVLPKDLVQNIFKTHFKNMHRAYYNAAEQIILDASKLFGVDSEEMAKAKELLVVSVNKAHDDAQLASKSDIENLVKEYSDGR